ncbi:condensin subunit Smc [Amphibacillus marinus]|uniref:Chromosome partition protein Smc n=1 Tax=Amphibacillus marinus TaxID=872970 RepID=A0A1H8HW83_9BACI|nr:chromosome segregation protein SMC [Amphibacillus marinus]SEN60254.1 condensin subunit Smc [Amphibacillus marinus]
MFLKKLESIGFKSFAERISVDFVPGVTAVVGPNGSGKSNVTDAIRWVLGEQSAKSLRGSKMEDIIFQGSDSRKPLNVAEVTLILDNQERTLPIDYQEVSVTRRVYRSGDSEFYLNKQSCRLKDITDLFLDSGLGREAFSIISQGKVEEILSSKAEERRTIFEEAAGVLKYKNRKKKAEYKLAETQENLNRVEDIIYEIEDQLEPLKQQASIAKEYLEKKEELANTEIALLHAEIETLHTEWQAMLTEVERLKDNERELNVHVQTESAQVEQEQQQIEKLDQQIEAYQQQLLSLTESLEKLTGQKNVIRERAKHTTENKQKLEQQLNELDSELTEIQSRLKEESDLLSGLGGGRTKTKQALMLINDQLGKNVNDIEQEIDSRKADFIELLNAQATTKHALQSFAKQIKQIDDRNDTSTIRHESSRNDYQQLQQEEAKLAADCQATAKDLARIKQTILTKTTQINHESSVIKDMQQKLLEGHRHIDKHNSRKELLEEMKEDFQGFYAGVKAVLKARDHGKLTGVQGAVAELITIPERYLAAMETALGGQGQHVVVQTEREARAAIQYLKKKNQGRATFLPLDAIQAKVFPEQLEAKLRNHSGFVALGNNVVEADSTVQIVKDYLLGQTIIAKTLADANALAKLVNRRYRVVTLDGDIVNPGGSMTGGAKKNNNQSIFSRDQELEGLKQKLLEYEQSVHRFEQEIASKESDLSAYQTELNKLNQAYDDKQASYHTLAADHHACQIKLSHFNDQLKVHEQDQARVNSEREQLVKELQQNEMMLKQLKAQISEIEQEVEQLERNKQNFNANREQLQAEANQLSIQLAEENKEYRFKQERIETLESQHTEKLAFEARLKAELVEIIKFEQEFKQVDQLEQQLELNEQDKIHVTEAIQTKRQERLMLTTALSEREAVVKTKQNQRQALIESRQKFEVRANRLDVELENRLSHLQEEYELSYEKAKQLYPKVESIDEARKQVKLIKRSIEELGTINIGAIEEFDRINERYHFLTEQQTDLIEAKETLFAVISEMDQEMERRFDETFTQIKAEFTVVFQQLFGGGHAALQLTDPASLLTTGVEIKAQPPGKKAQQLALLSGGERALTAIALLFAILRVRPVPFCVLDEVEAALDEANVERFSRYLKQYSENTQFIVITHRKGTMEGADVLYGVTMQESGVSRFVSVKLEETKELLES